MIQQHARVRPFEYRGKRLETLTLSEKLKARAYIEKNLMAMPLEQAMYGQDLITDGILSKEVLLAEMANE